LKVGVRFSISFTQKFCQFFHEGIELIVMYPMSSVGESDDPSMAKVQRASILLGIGCAMLALITPQYTNLDLAD
jgi:hypothetical protein